MHSSWKTWISLDPSICLISSLFSSSLACSCSLQFRAFNYSCSSKAIRQIPQWSSSTPPSWPSARDDWGKFSGEGPFNLYFIVGILSLTKFLIYSGVYSLSLSSPTPWIPLRIWFNLSIALTLLASASGPSALYLPLSRNCDKKLLAIPSISDELAWFEFELSF